YRLLGGAARALIVCELDERDRGCGVALLRLVVGRNLVDGRGGRRQESLDARGVAQPLGERAFELVRLVVLKVLDDLVLDLREVGVELRLVLVVEVERLRLRDDGDFRRDLRVEHGARRHAALLRLLREKYLVDLLVNVVLAQEVDLLPRLRDEREQRVFNVARRDLFAVDRGEDARALGGAGGRRHFRRQHLHGRGGPQRLGELLPALLLP